MSADAVTVGKLPKPDMRRLFYNRAKWILIGATLTSIGTTLAWKTLVTDVRKKKYAEFYANYDPVKEFKRLKECGVYKSIPCD